jgi:hypothetical protein
MIYLAGKEVQLSGRKETKSAKETKKNSKISKHIDNKRKIRTNVRINAISKRGLQCAEYMQNNQMADR